MKEEKKQTFNCFDSHAPKSEWIEAFLSSPETFLDENNLGPNQIKSFKRFLNDASLIDTRKKTVLPLGMVLQKYNVDDELVPALMLIELAHNNAQFGWYINNMDVGQLMLRESLAVLLTEQGATENDTKFIISALKRIASESPFGNSLHFVEVTTKGRIVTSATRTKCSVTDPRVLLYALYKYAEENDGYYSFSLTTLLDKTIDSVGISPAKIFGLEFDDLEPMLRGLSAQYNDYINVTFTHDLDKITLRDYHTSADILKLLED